MFVDCWEPNTGVFLRITADAGDDLPVPWKQCSFAIVELAQVQDDLAVLNQRKRRPLRVHLAKGSAGIESLVVAIADAMKR
jgi:transaldolase / glucose-6-phosphate isomerase